MIHRKADVSGLADTYDIAIIGAGPAGMSAASEAAAAGLKTIVFDENPTAGGQIYRGIEYNTEARRPFLGEDYWQGSALLQTFLRSNACYLPEALVWSVEQIESHNDAYLEIRVSAGGKSKIVQARRLILATGAMERPMPVQGWTLPGVMTIGAAQIALKASGLMPNKNVVLAGAGPLLYMFAAQLLEAGGKISALLDTTPRANWMKAAPHLLSFFTSSYAFKGLSLLWKVKKSVPIYSGVEGLRITGTNKAEAVEFTAKGKQRWLAVDGVFLHQGVIPNINLTNSIGCDLVWNDRQKCFQPRLDKNGLTSMKSVYVAGDGGGIGGAVVAECSGKIAALAACQELIPARSEFWRQRLKEQQATIKRLLRGRDFIDALYLPAQNYRAPQNNDVIICRCEEVTAGAIREAASQNVVGPNQLKTMLRCGMGPCQGRMCLSTVTELLAEAQNRRPQDVGSYRLRAPIKPVPLSEIATLPQTPDAIFAVTGEHPDTPNS
ncbi:NAD(P)/FAD-dependent oxidoreductase [Falsochrobactrum ovis]|uniref:Thioredoxin reductase n=1 Tax=Falsochrobactrum ovis TaxID=1293442 RepID=A0A364JTS6_9HYPH|nr:FAD-dependent oxidoreductase [Falsochrobactrum ovis]RAK27342.1 thioredoxin reductase [Falsochrobactrum ovis]